MFRLVDRPALQPWQTIIGAASGTVVDTEVTISANGVNTPEDVAAIDTGKVIPGYGRVYLSRIEVWSAARLMPDVVEGLARELGWVDTGDAETLRGEIARLNAELEVARQRIPQVVTLEQARVLLEQAAV